MRIELFSVAALLLCAPSARARQDAPVVESHSGVTPKPETADPAPAAAGKSAASSLPDRPLPRLSEKHCEWSGPACQDLSLRPNPNPPKPAAVRPVSKEPRVADKKFWVMSGLTAGSGLFTWHAGRVCRSRNGVEPCFQHYGAFNAMEGVRLGGSAILVPALAHWWKSDHPKSWWAIPLGMIGFNVGQAFQELSIRRKGPS
jgi:hypothetical protein